MKVKALERLLGVRRVHRRATDLILGSQFYPLRAYRPIEIQRVSLKSPSTYSNVVLERIFFRDKRFLFKEGLS